MKYLLHTDTLRDLMSVVPNATLLRRTAMVPSDAQATSSVTLAELLDQAQGSGGCTPDALSRIQAAVTAHLPVLPFDIPAARCYVELRNSLPADGLAISHSDLQIASIAVAHDLVVITGAPRRFEQVPALRVESWSA